jgi:putative membrane protein
MDRVLQILVNAGALYAAEYVVEGISFSGEWWKFLLVALAFSLLNTYLRPILRILTFPITIVSLGLFLLVINAGMLLLTGAVSEQLDLGFRVVDFWSALFGAVVVAVVGWLLSMVAGTGRLVGKAM